MVKRKTTPGKLPREAKVFAFANLVQQILDQTHVDRHFQLVEADGTPCITEASVDARLRALVREQKPEEKEHCYVSVISTYCIENGCPNAHQIQHKMLRHIIRFSPKGAVGARVWCDFCKLTLILNGIVPKILEPHPKKHFAILHPVTNAACHNESDITEALRSYRAIIPNSVPTHHMKVSVKSTHIHEECKCSEEHVKEYMLHNIAFNFDDGPSVRVWGKSCAKSIIGAKLKEIQPKGQDANHCKESSRQAMLTQIKELSEFSFSRIQQGRVYDMLISEASDTAGIVVQHASSCRGKDSKPASLGKTLTQIVDVLESGGLFIGQEMAKDGERMLRIIVLPPSALPLVRDIALKNPRFSRKIVETFKEFVFECEQPNHMKKMAQLIERHVADPASARMNLQTADSHVDNFTTFLEHVGIEAILRHNRDDTSAGIRTVDHCQGDFLAFQKLVEVKTLRRRWNKYGATIKAMPKVDIFIGIVLADNVRETTRTLFDALKDRRKRRQPCDDIILDLDNFLDGHVIDGIFKFVDPATSIRSCPGDKRDMGFSVSQIDGKIESKYIHDYTKASYIDTTNVPNRGILDLILDKNM